MSDFCTAHRLPRAQLDPIGNDEAQALLVEVFSVPLRHETVALVLDHEHCGISILAVDDTVDPDSVLSVADAVAHAALHDPSIGAVVLASVRPGGGDELDDVERWHDLDMTFGDVGVELLEWYVVGDFISRPRVLLGEPDRWLP
jgi:hypothetical protein